MYKRTILGLMTVVSSLYASENNGMTLMQEKIEHVVVLMMENRSFDNVLAWLYENDAPLTLIPENLSPPYLGLSEDTLVNYTNDLKNSAGKVVYSCCPIKGVPSVSKSLLLNSPRYDTNEPFPNVMVQIFGIEKGAPLMRGFLQDYASNWSEDEWESDKSDICAVLETYTSKELPVLYSLAKHYAISDYWFSSVPTQTNPNRAFSICGTSEGQIVNGPLLLSTFKSDTIWNRLEELTPDTTWKVFWQADYVPVMYPGPYSGVYSFSALSRIPHWDQHFHMIDHFHELARSGDLPAFSFLEPEWTLSINISAKDRELEISQDEFIGIQGNDYHPPSDVHGAENFLANVYTSLIGNPEAWNKTLLVILFDEHGGLFDHIPPPKAIPPDNNFQNGFRFDLYGVRVPALFISPYVGKSVVVRSGGEIPFDHTSLLATILKWKNIDRKQWKLGLRTFLAPTFDTVLTLSETRQDPILSNEPLDMEASNQFLSMNEPFYLSNVNHEYIVIPPWGLHNVAHFGSEENKVTLQFVGGTGPITHGSFVLIQSNDPELSSNNILKCSLWGADCIYDFHQHNSQQWWTIKSLDHPFVGYPISYGDRVYLENHVYLDAGQYVPGRLKGEKHLFGNYLVTKPIFDKDSADNFWNIEKP